MQKRRSANQISGTVIALLSTVCLLFSTFFILTDILRISLFGLSYFYANLLGLILFFIGGLGTLLYVGMCKK